MASACRAAWSSRLSRWSTSGAYTVKVLPDGWTVKTRDGKLSAHYENTIAITDGEPEILTSIDGEVL